MEPIKVWVLGRWHDATYDEVTGLVYFNGCHAALGCFERHLRVIRPMM